MCDYMRSGRLELDEDSFSSLSLELDKDSFRSLSLWNKEDVTKMCYLNSSNQVLYGALQWNKKGGGGWQYQTSFINRGDRYIVYNTVRKNIGVDQIMFFVADYMRERATLSLRLQHHALVDNYITVQGELLCSVVQWNTGKYAGAQLFFMRVPNKRVYQGLAIGGHFPEDIVLRPFYRHIHY